MEKELYNGRFKMELQDELKFYYKDPEGKYEPIDSYLKEGFIPLPDEKIKVLEKRLELTKKDRQIHLAKDNFFELADFDEQFREEFGIDPSARTMISEKKIGSKWLGIKGLTWHRFALEERTDLVPIYLEDFDDYELYKHEEVHALAMDNPSLSVESVKDHEAYASQYGASSPSFRLSFIDFALCWCGIFWPPLFGILGAKKGAEWFYERKHRKDLAKGLKKIEARYGKEGAMKTLMIADPDSIKNFGKEL